MCSATLFRRAGSAASAVSRFSPTTVTMPLRAKILAPKAVSEAQISYDAGPEGEDCLFGSLYGLRTIELHRPKKLNSLDLSMIRKITPRLLEWEKSDMANVVVMKGAGDKAFCAGGDVAALAKLIREKGQKGQRKCSEYFAAEYSLDHLIATLKTPYVAFMDGITMGGGVGLSVHAPLRIATERTVFAMPETTIGFFPDVGASFFLPRLPGYIGTYLALTSDRVTGVNVFYSGIATHYLHSTSLPSLESRLAELRFNDYDDAATRLKSISATIEEYTTGLPHDQPMLFAGELRNAIDRCFSKASVAEIITALESEQGSTREWAQKTIDTLRQRSPIAVNVTLTQLRTFNGSIRAAFEKEHELAAKFMAHPDFAEGVTARLMSKPPRRPDWQPASLEEVTPDAVQDFFEPPAAENAVIPIEFHNNHDFEEYPHRELGLPTEVDVFEVVSATHKRTRREVVNFFIGKARGKLGVEQVVEEILARKSTKDENGKAVWLSDE